MYLWNSSVDIPISVDVHKTSLFLNFQSILMLRFWVMHDLQHYCIKTDCYVWIPDYRHPVCRRLYRQTNKSARNIFLALYVPIKAPIVKNQLFKEENVDFLQYVLQEWWVKQDLDYLMTIYTQAYYYHPSPFWPTIPLAVITLVVFDKLVWNFTYTLIKVVVTVP